MLPDDLQWLQEVYIQRDEGISEDSEYPIFKPSHNPQTKGIRPSEIRELFPNCRVEMHRITLAPPLTRLLIKGSWVICLLLENLSILNTHYLAKITLK